MTSVVSTTTSAMKSGVATSPPPWRTQKEPPRSTGVIGMIRAKARLSPIHAALHHAAERSVTSRGPRRDARKTPRSTASSASTNAANSTHSHELTCIVTPGSQVGSFGEHAVHELNADGPLADRRCDAVDATGSNIADREDARD